MVGAPPNADVFPCISCGSSTVPRTQKAADQGRKLWVGMMGDKQTTEPAGVLEQVDRLTDSAQSQDLA